ncbi:MULTISPECIES: hypothetical protein [Acinetobacter]|uniref:Uncharacterized protein n=1 Tax=Acinetobacter wuhouensis TaxID=1879050 RepID=A0A3G2SWJ2_9GAMM|nr:MULTISPECIES: hypothetical protein [Acinetobacter]AYO52189.1 hypothetical protein CDG68_00090 [Acinetobacter wuhouensis]MCU4623218.1 hypothetical protein [Acinetobacter radioresistens]OOW09311.1 hypothetical protein MF4640_16335 [Acinetobacter sp. MF4640]
MKKITQNEKGQMFYEGSLVLTAKDGSVFFVSTEMLVCKAYRAKAKKPFLNYRYRTLERLKQAVSENIQSCNARHERKLLDKEKNAERIKKFREELQVGDILSTCWGYEQTNVEFYQVISKAGAFCEVREIAKRSHDTAYMQSEVSPKQNEFIGEPIRKKILDGYIMITSYIRATPHEYEILETGTKVYKRSYVSSYA